MTDYRFHIVWKSWAGAYEGSVDNNMDVRVYGPTPLKCLESLLIALGLDYYDADTLAIVPQTPSYQAHLSADDSANNSTQDISANPLMTSDKPSDTSFSSQEQGDN